MHKILNKSNRLNQSLRISPPLQENRLLGVPAELIPLQAQNQRLHRTIENMSMQFKQHQHELREVFRNELQTLKISILELSSIQKRDTSELVLDAAQRQNQLRESYQLRLQQLKQQLTQQVEINERLHEDIRLLGRQIADRDTLLRKQKQAQIKLQETFSHERQVIRNEIYSLNDEKDNMIGELKAMVREKMEEASRTEQASKKQVQRLHNIIAEKMDRAAEVQQALHNSERDLLAQCESKRVIEDKFQLALNDLAYHRRKFDQELLTRENQIARILREFEQQNQEMKACQSEVVSKRREIQQVLKTTETAKQRLNQAIDSKIKDNHALKENLVASENEAKRLKGALQNLKRQSELLERKALDMSNSLKERECKIRVQQNRVQVLQELVQSEQKRIKILQEQLQQHQKGFVKDLLQIQLEKYIGKFQSQIAAMEQSHTNERQRMKQMMEYQLADQASLNDRRVKLYEDEIKELQVRLESTYTLLHEQRMSK